MFASTIGYCTFPRRMLYIYVNIYIYTAAWRIIYNDAIVSLLARPQILFCWAPPSLVLRNSKAAYIMHPLTLCSARGVRYIFRRIIITPVVMREILTCGSHADIFFQELEKNRHLAYNISRSAFLNKPYCSRVERFYRL